MNTPSRSIALEQWHVRIAFVLIGTVLLWVTGLPGMLLRADAAQLTTISDTLSTSAPNVAANHTLEFTTPTGVPADGTTVVITIPTGFAMGLVAEDDIDIADDGIDLTTANTCGAVQAAVTVSGQDITIEICNGGGGAIAAASTVTVEIGSHADASGTGTNQITNHASVGTYEVTVTGTMADEGYLKVAILETVKVSGEVENFFIFTILGVDADQTVNADATQTTATSTATVVPFGFVAPGSEYVLAQDITVSTNSANGFTVAVFADGDLQSSSGATIDSFNDGTATGTPITWRSPSATVSDTDTYGHWGLTTEDISLSDDDSFGNALYVGDFVSAMREVMYATSSADAETAHIGKTRVGYKLEISTLQEAASDYTTSLVYIATPVF